MSLVDRRDWRPDRCCVASVASITVLLLLLAACGPRFATTPATAPSASPVTIAAPPTKPATTPAATAETSPATTTSSPPTTTQDVASEQATIATNWERFFLPTTSIADRVGLLENGATLQQALEQRAKDPLQQQASAKVKAVELTAPDRATVTYDVYLSGAVALPDGQGIAVLQDGVWKVSADSFCALVALGAAAPIPGCG